MKIKGHPHVRPVRKELRDLWYKNLKEILKLLMLTQTDLAKEIGSSRQTVVKFLNRDDEHLTGMHFLATMHAILKLIDDASDYAHPDKVEVEEAWRLYTEIQKEYVVRGLFDSV